MLTSALQRPARHKDATGPENELLGAASAHLWATSLLEDGVPIHRVSNRLGHADLRTTSRYATEHPDQIDDVSEVLDRRHQAARRARR